MLGREANITTAAVLKRYEEISGCVPGDESTDTGCDERTVLKNWLKQPFQSHGLTAFRSVKVPHSTAVTDTLHFRQALWTLGGLYLGLNLPISAQDQIAHGKPWEVVSGPDGAASSWGGHAVIAVGFDVDGVTLVTWGRLQRASWAWLSAYMSESYGLVSGDWLKSGKSPQGFDVAQLESDLAALRAS